MQDACGNNVRGQHVHAFMKMNVCVFSTGASQHMGVLSRGTGPRNVNYATEIGIAQGAAWWKRQSETLGPRLRASLWDVAVWVLHVSPHVQHFGSFPQLLQFFHLATADELNVEMAANESKSKPVQQAHR